MDFLIKVRVKDYFLSGLQEALQLIYNLKSSSEYSNRLVFSNKSVFVSPLFVGVTLLHLFQKQNKIDLLVEHSYLNTIFFQDKGLRIEKIGDIPSFLSGYSKKTYLPILSFPTDEKSELKRNEITSAALLLLKDELNFSGSIYTGISYLLAETIDNISQHSCADRGYLFCQAYPNKRYMDVCIFDDGISLLGSYKRVGMQDINSDDDAIRAVVEHRLSTKNKPNAENRGFGIYTSRKMLVNGLGGEFLLLSGNAMFFSNPQYEQNFISIPNDITFKGTLVGMRIPYLKSEFNPAKYYE